MSIWAYNANVRDAEAIAFAMEMTQCVYCNTPLETPKSEKREGVFEYLEEFLRIRCCPACGWWTKYEESWDVHQWGDYGPVQRFQKCGAVGSLCELDLEDQSVPLEEVRAYLAANYDARFSIDPWKLEATVASVYRDLGFRARVTGRSGDGGIDVILDGPGDSVVGVQVKRYRGKIKAEQIRSLAGALLINGLTRGAFVTTSTFQPGAHSAAERFRLRGMPVELIDAPRFFEALRLAQRERYRPDSDPTAPFSGASMILLD